MPNFLQNFDLFEFAITMVALVICITIHEFSHAMSAYRAGDNTPKAQGRISLNPIDHLDPMGTIMMVVSSLSGFGIGWGKPVRVNPANFNSPRWDNLKVSLWGPLSNLLTAAVTGTALRFIIHNTHSPSTVLYNLVTLLTAITLVSIGLAIFNLIPIGPLDGAHILSSLLPYEQARNYDRFMAQYGLMIFLGLVFFGGTVLHVVIGVPSHFLWELLTGMRY